MRAAPDGARAAADALLADAQPVGANLFKVALTRRTLGAVLARETA